MKIRRFAGIISGAIFAIVAFVPLAHAQEMNEGTRITFSEPVRIPGQLLSAGTYYFERANHGNAPNLNQIQIYDADHSHLLATIETVTAQRKHMTGGTMLTFAEGSNGEALALVDWFYPGMLNGHEFLYPRREERRIEASKREYMLINNDGVKIVQDANGD
jgi:hypothetical protein